MRNTEKYGGPDKAAPPADNPRASASTSPQDQDLQRRNDWQTQKSFRAPIYSRKESQLKTTQPKEIKPQLSNSYNGSPPIPLQNKYDLLLEEAFEELKPTNWEPAVLTGANTIPLPKRESKDTNIIIIISGDFNIHVNDIKNNFSIQFLSLLDRFGLVNNINFATHKSGNFLDVIITRVSDNLDVLLSQPHDFISDHRLISLKIRFPTLNTERRQITFRNIKSIDTTSLIQDISNSDIKTINNEMDLNDMVHIYDTTLSSILDFHAPKINKFINFKSISPWYNKNLKLLKIEKIKAERKFQRTLNNDDWNILQGKLISYRIACTNIKTGHSKKIIQNCDDQKKNI